MKYFSVTLYFSLKIGEAYQYGEIHFHVVIALDEATAAAIAAFKLSLGDIKQQVTITSVEVIEQVAKDESQQRYFDREGLR